MMQAGGDKGLINILDEMDVVDLPFVLTTPGTGSASTPPSRVAEEVKVSEEAKAPKGTGDFWHSCNCQTVFVACSECMAQEGAR